MAQTVAALAIPTVATYLLPYTLTWTPHDPPLPQKKRKRTLINMYGGHQHGRLPPSPATRKIAKTKNTWEGRIWSMAAVGLHFVLKSPDHPGHRTRPPLSARAAPGVAKAAKAVAWGWRPAHPPVFGPKGRGFKSQGTVWPNGWG